ncbi:LysR substrate-binding domain-containing protein [Microbacterium hydrocarbonoxydans]|uniref:LysR substrate-binding domain-containing protein n=1 Tax=Microbacterium hydrocarbonoxydans TaxID=273678 RepID=UPI0007BB7F72|nr:LysR substrate-binding domain-containing protein [Microbacterium hydrocarbonoxydans]GAT74039.1 transcriptional regulator, LysR familyprotein [Microbacterium sp. HM58-2]
MARLARPDMTLVQLRYFLAAATKRSMTEASLDLHVAQSAVSTAIAQLERGLGVQLFVRQRSRGLALTDAGEQLLLDARSLLAQVDEMTDTVRGKHYDVRGTLRLACFVTLAPFVLPRLISRVRELHPNLRIEIIEADVDGTTDLLLSGSVEAAIAYDFGRAHDLTFDRLYTSAPHVILAHDHPLAGREELALTDLDGEDLVLLDTPHSREYFLGMHEAAGVEPRVRYTSRSYETIRSLVGRGEGYSVLNHIPQSPMTYDGGEVVAVPLAGPRADPLEVCFVRVTNVRPTARARVIGTLAREMFGSGASGPA